MVSISVISSLSLLSQVIFDASHNLIKTRLHFDALKIEDNYDSYVESVIEVVG